MSKEAAHIVEFTLIYNRYKGKLYNYTYKMVNNGVLSEDIVQNVFMRFFENMPEIKNKEIYEFWLFKSARNEVYNHYRSKKVRNNVYESADLEELAINETEGIEYTYDHKELHGLILKELATFPIEQRECFLLKEYSRLTYKEIGDITGTPEELVKSRLYKARRKLAEKISKILFYGV